MADGQSRLPYCTAAAAVAILPNTAATRCRSSIPSHYPRRGRRRPIVCIINARLTPKAGTDDIAAKPPPVFHLAEIR